MWTDAAYRTEPNLVVPLQRLDGTPVVVKAVRADVLEPGEYAGERDALRHYAALRLPADVRAERLLAADDELRVLELERVTGSRLDTGWPDARDDAEVMADIARAMRSLWAAPAIDAAWRELALWMQALDAPVAGIDAAVLARARDLGRELQQGAVRIVLHADLHHENIFRQADGALVVIDPKGILGAPGFDLGAALWNPWGRVLSHPRADRLMATRIDVLAAELAMDRAEVQAWGWVVAILSAAWLAESDTDPAYPLGVAGLIDPVAMW
ncbi:MAG: aminoglycoside phosphotransferase family protein [Jatrophihabitans sp.]